MAHISCVEISSSFLVDIFPEYRTPRAFAHLEFTARHRRVHALSEGVYPSALVK